MPCPHNMPNPKTCLDCMEEGNLEPPKWKFNAYFNAKFPGICRKCGGGYEAGEPIKQWHKEDQDTAYTHFGCGLN